MNKTAVDFFNPKDKTHMEAYAHLRETGSWPHEFCEKMDKEGCSFPPYYIFSIESKIAGFWAEFCKQYL